MYVVAIDASKDDIEATDYKVFERRKDAEDRFYRAGALILRQSRSTSLAARSISMPLDYTRSTHGTPAQLSLPCRRVRRPCSGIPTIRISRSISRSWCPICSRTDHPSGRRPAEPRPSTVERALLRRHTHGGTTAAVIPCMTMNTSASPATAAVSQRTNCQVVALSP